MTLGIMQPYFLPYFGYFTLISQVDKFILFDTPQFIRHGWIERNRILKPDGDTLYIRVPLKKHSRETAIKDVIINNSENWKDKIFAQLVPYKKKAPNYWSVLKLLEDCLSIDTYSVVDLNQHVLKTICNYLSINVSISIWSEMNIEIEEVEYPDEWALNICKSMGAKEYINPIGGIEFFNPHKYLNQGIDIKFLKPMPTPYEQMSKEFVPFLSIIDTLMFCDINQTQNIINKFEYE